MLEVTEEAGSRSGGGGGSSKLSGNTEVSNAIPSSLAAPSRPQVTADSLEPLSFSALNFYHERDGKPALDIPWLRDVKLIEPHRDTTLAVTAPRGGFKYLWTVHGGDPEKADLRAEASGAEAIIKLTVLDDNMITLEEVDEATGKVARRLEEKVMVKYVRREIRTLTDDEREELFDAVSANSSVVLIIFGCRAARWILSKSTVACCCLSRSTSFTPPWRLASAGGAFVFSRGERGRYYGCTLCRVPLNVKRCRVRNCCTGLFTHLSRYKILYVQASWIPRRLTCTQV